MIIVRANARNATYISDDLITSGSVGIPVTFNLSEDFDGLSCIAVFEGSGASIDVALMGNTCVVPHEVLATAGGYLRIGIYASNSAGTIVIPTVWAGSKMILQGTEPSEVDPPAPTPSWVAQVQEAAAEAVQTSEEAIEIAQRVEDMSVDAETLPAGSEATVEKTVDPDTGVVMLEFGIPRGEQGEPGPQGDSGVYVGSDEPSDDDVNVWIDPNGNASVIDAGEVGYDDSATYNDGTVGKAVSDLMSQIIPTTALPSIWTNGKYVAGANVEINNAYYSIADFDVSNIETDVLISSFGSASAGWVLLSTTGSVISRSLFAGSTGDTYNYTRYVTVPVNGKTLRVSCHTAEKSQQSVTYTTSRFEPLENDYCILSEFDNIFCAGDSLTWGAVYTGSGSSDFRAAKKPYNVILQLRTGAAVARNAQPGIDAIRYVGKLSSIIEKTNQLVIIYLGTNGGLTDTLDTDAPGLDKSQYDLTTETGSYAYIVKHCLDVNAKVLLVKIYAGGGLNGVSTTNTVIGKVAEKFGVAVIENKSLPQKYHIWPNGQGYDYTHLNDFGYAAFAEYLIRQVNAMDTTTLARILPNN